MKKATLLVFVLISLMLVIPIYPVSAGTEKVGLLTITPTSVLINPGDSATFDLTISRTQKSSSTSGKFDASLTIAGLPPGATAEFSPAIVYFGSNDYTPKPSQLKITGIQTSSLFTVRVTRNDAPWDYKEVSGEFRINTPPILDPIIFDDGLVVGEEFTFTATASDPDVPDYQSLSFSLVGLTNGASITSDGNFTWTPNALGPFKFVIQVSDGIATDSEEITVNVDYNVRAGTNINVALEGGVELTFSQVNSKGLAESSSSDDPTTFGFYPLTGIRGFYYQITFSNGDFSTVTVAIPYDDTGLTKKQESNLRLFTSDEGASLPCDFNGDGVVDVKDQTLLTNAINSASQGHPYDENWQFDVQPDGAVNQQDLEDFKPHLGESIWVDITSWVDTTNNIIYGVTGHFSGFGVR